MTSNMQTHWVAMLKEIFNLHNFFKALSDMHKPTQVFE